VRPQLSGNPLGSVKSDRRRALSSLAVVERFFTRYIAAFDAFDAEAIASFYNVPCMMIRAGDVATLSTRSAVLANMQALVSLYRSQGYERAHFGDLRAAFLDAGVALVTVPTSERSPRSAASCARVARSS
jgi:hypothetical protein